MPLEARSDAENNRERNTRWGKKKTPIPSPETIENFAQLSKLFWGPNANSFLMVPLWVSGLVVGAVVVGGRIRTQTGRKLP